MELIMARDGHSTCQGYDKVSGVVAQDRMDRLHMQGDPALSSLTGIFRRNTNGKRHAGDDGSDGEDNDRAKLRRIAEHADRPLPCPFAIRYHEIQGFQGCTTKNGWKLLREHLLTRTHRPRDQCPTCGTCFDDDDGWKEHTRGRKCRRPEKGFVPLICMDRDQESQIRELTRQGARRNLSDEELWREVWEILFKDQSCTIWPYSKGIHTDDLQTRIQNLQGMELVPAEDRMELAMRCYNEVERWKQARSAQGYVNATVRQSDVAEYVEDFAVQFKPTIQSFQAPQMPAFNSNDSLGMPLFGSDFPDETSAFSYPQLDPYPITPINDFDLEVDSSLLYMDFTLLNLQPTLPNDSSSRPNSSSAILPADTFEFEHGQATLQDQLSNLEDFMSDEERFRIWEFLDFSLGGQHLSFDGGNAEQEWRILPD
ncbi:hypothetical protein J7T55_012234 [Diaporthe amygdali]|uniref:uncharacterized protein n=1 Tax=Phomopsis amygdali TaxID=1214568 RepID=UPI0022FF1BF2|nr:uncharacterized protein J7T55_012234 [Diaporthe amygdali]KAJ0123765.1 hypothetical protein J7T55_012234 [Diaporthe amygdali]